MKPVRQVQDGEAKSSPVARHSELGPHGVGIHGSGILIGADALIDIGAVFAKSKFC